MIGFILVLLCLVGSQTPSGRGLYFAKVTDAESNASFTAYYGWQGYCIQEADITCYSDRSVMIVPFDVSIVSQLNTTYPRLFQDKIEQDTDLNPGAAPNPPHDPKIYPAAVLCLLCSATLLVFCILRVTVPHRYRDEHYTRGFLAWGSALLALLLLILSSTMYQNAIDQLNRAYPHLIASQGPGMTMIGCAFASFALAGYFLLRGCMSLESNHPEGYSPI
ncbi:uncharacterized protein B0P05DRAFT_479135 [Gilbertella persicaria]|uniref:uncharacterized protein n=1 Tax=Gilbertella persicaria TaxID=101096 RepID=UPI00221FC3DF|nr:uncharacterized protein B0P05DRAFT_479135 [Gilbertella persicaria]KAI8056305.1 hypothetical protein B0P05DRAFT_479135 [Gilbertella persicaria]